MVTKFSLYKVQDYLSVHVQIFLQSSKCSDFVFQDFIVQVLVMSRFVVSDYVSCAQTISLFKIHRSRIFYRALLFEQVFTDKCHKHIHLDLVDFIYPCENSRQAVKNRVVFKAKA